MLLPTATGAQAVVVGAPRHTSGTRVLTVGDRAVQLALRQRGVPYAWAGTTPAGFDCSGFTRFVYAQLGIRLPHSSYAQWDLGRHVPRSQLRPGDLVFFAGLGHVGIYIGGGRFIHSPESGEVVSIAPLGSGWYAASYDGAVRLPHTQSPWRRPGNLPEPARHFVNRR